MKYTKSFGHENLINFFKNKRILKMSNDETLSDTSWFDYDKYENSFQNRAKQGWIVFQVLMMTIYMIIGIRAYSKIQPQWTKTKSLFVVQTVAVVYLEVNEFTGRNIRGFYLILIFTSYSLFLTFSLVVDSCQTSADDEKQSDIHIVNKIYRISMHVITLALFCGTFTIKECDQQIYPTMFVCVIAVTLTH